MPFTLALALNNSAITARKCGFHELAIEGYRRCIQIREYILANQPDDWTSRDYLAGTLSNLSAVLCDIGRKGEALETIDQAVLCRSELLRMNAEPELRVTFAKVRLNRASILFQMERWSEAVQGYAQVIDTVAPLMEFEGRSDLRTLIRIAKSSQDTALRRIEERSSEEADAFYTEIVAGERKAMGQGGGNLRCAALSRLLSNWAGVKHALNQPGAAWLLLEEAIGLIENSEQGSQFSEVTDSLIICYQQIHPITPYYTAQLQS
jgi:tetratricopeptide (TPR) repeat protein